MNVETNELRRERPDINDPEFEKFTPVPDNLQKEAEEVLGDKDSVFLPMDTKSRLARWANKIRVKQSKSIHK